MGGAIGLAVLATLSTTRTENLLANGDSSPEALLGGYELAWVIGAGLLVVALAVAISVLRPVDAGEAGAEGELAELPGAEPAYSEAA